MIKTVNVTPVYNEGETPGFKKITGLDVFIECDVKDADEIFKMIKKMANFWEPTESKERKDDD
jgi:hypothetical protein